MAPGAARRCPCRARVILSALWLLALSSVHVAATPSVATHPRVPTLFEEFEDFNRRLSFSQPAMAQSYMYPGSTAPLSESEVPVPSRCGVRHRLLVHDHPSVVVLVLEVAAAKLNQVVKSRNLVNTPSHKLSKQDVSELRAPQRAVAKAAKRLWALAQCDEYRERLVSAHSVSSLIAALALAKHLGSDSESEAMEHMLRAVGNLAMAKGSMFGTRNISRRFTSVPGPACSAWNGSCLQAGGPGTYCQDPKMAIPGNSSNIVGLLTSSLRNGWTAIDMLIHIVKSPDPRVSMRAKGMAAGGLRQLIMQYQAFFVSPSTEPFYASQASVGLGTLPDESEYEPYYVHQLISKAGGVGALTTLMKSTSEDTLKQDIDAMYAKEQAVEVISQMATYCHDRYYDDDGSEYQYYELYGEAHYYKSDYELYGEYAYSIIQLVAVLKNGRVHGLLPSCCDPG